MRGVPNPQPCPNPSCPHPTSVEVSRYPVHRVCCEGCGMEGPMALVKKGPREAVRLWDALPRARWQRSAHP